MVQGNAEKRRAQISNSVFYKKVLNIIAFCIKHNYVIRSTVATALCIIMHATERRFEVAKWLVK